jgi:hypothetical protein
MIRLRVVALAVGAVLPSIANTIFAKPSPRKILGRNNRRGGRPYQRYRPLGINAYGFNPYTATEEESHTEHGNDERIRVEEVRRGPRTLFDVAAAVAGAK